MAGQWLLIAGGLAVFNALFLGATLILLNGHLKNKLLGMLFIALALRTGKSVVIILFSGLPDSVPAIGLLGMALVGPLLLYYLHAFNKGKFGWKDFSPYHLLFPSAVVMLLFANSPAVVFWLYVAAAVHLLSYLCFVFYSRNHLIPIPTTDNGKWIRILIAVLTVHWAIYSSQIFVESRMAYMIATTIVALSLYVPLYFGLRIQKVFSSAKQSNKSLPNQVELKTKLLSLFDKEKIFMQPDLTLSSLAKRLGSKPYVVSSIINSEFGQSFPEFINHHRINEAKQLLLTADFKLTTIEGIAFECGYNTPSAFYNSFRKHTKMTPSEFRAVHQP